MTQIKFHESGKLKTAFNNIGLLIITYPIWLKFGTLEVTKEIQQDNSFLTSDSARSSISKLFRLGTIVPVKRWWKVQFANCERHNSKQHVVQCCTMVSRTWINKFYSLVDLRPWYIASLKSLAPCSALF